MKKGMDSELINIQNIRNLESIRYTEHLLSKGLIPILQITYDGGKYMILSSTDKYFYSFVKKVIDVYNLEKNSIVDDSLTDPFRIRNKIDIDSKTEKVLESGILTDINSLYSFYKDKHAYNKSLIYQIDEVKSLLPMLIYHLEDFLTSFIVKSTFDTNISGYKDNYTLNAQIDGLEKYIGISFDEINENEYDFEISGIFDNLKTIKVKIKFDNDRITISGNIDLSNVEFKYTYLATLNNVKCILEVIKDNKTIYYKNDELEETTVPYPNLTSLDSTNNLKWYILPWNAYYGIDNNVEKLSDSQRVVETHTMYFGLSSDNFIKKEEYSKRLIRTKNDSYINEESITLDEMGKSTICIKLYLNDNIYLIETSFSHKDNESGFYSEMLSDNYFYHIASSRSIEELSKERTIEIDDNIVLKDYDLLKRDKILSLVRGIKNE